MDLLKTKISFIQLQEMIYSWLQKTQKLVKIKQIQKHYKYQLINVSKISQQIMYKTFQYFYLIKFACNLKDSQTLITQKKILLSAQLKQFYHQKIVSQEWKREFDFQFSLIYIIEIISLFIKEKFPFLKINQVLKGQIFIILIHVFLGIEVGTKAFHITSKKYKANAEKQRMSKKKQLKSYSLEKKPSITLSDKYSQKAVHDFIKYSEKSKAMNQIKTRQNISIIQTKTGQKKSLFQNFTQNLKQNLFVDPLPPMQIKQMSIIQFDRLNIQGQQQLKVQLNEVKKFSQEMKRKHINSMTISASLDIQLKKKNNPLSTTDYLKSSNLSFKPQHHSKHYQNFLNKKQLKYEPIRTEIQHKVAKSKSKKIQHDEWRQIIKRMKLNAYKPIQILNNSIKSSAKQNMQFQQMIQKKLKKQQSKHNQIHNQSINTIKRQSLLKNDTQNQLSTKKVKTQQDQFSKSAQLINSIMYMNIMQSTKGGKQNSKSEITNKLKQKFTQIKGEKAQSYQSILMKSGKLKLKKLQFFKQCQNRTSNIHHSAFQLKHKLAI